MKLLVFGFLIALQFCRAKSDCIFQNFSIDDDAKPIFIQKIGKESVILPVKSSKILIQEASFIEVFCSHGFRREYLGGDADSYISKIAKSVQITCTSGKVQGRKDDSFYDFPRDAKLYCKRPTVSVYEDSSKKGICEHSWYIVGMKYADTTTILAEICYDLEEMKTIYQHYMAIPRSAVISKQHKYSPIPFPQNLNGPIDVPALHLTSHIKEEEVSFENKQRIHIGNAEFIFDDLIPNDAFEPYFSKPMLSTNYVGKTLWWNGLKSGNWKLFEKLLKIQSRVQPLDVVMGTTGVAMFPPSDRKDCGDLKEITYEINSIPQKIPEYIWAYIHPNDRNVRDEGYVVIGVNTPYLDLEEYHYVSPVRRHYSHPNEQYYNVTPPPQYNFAVHVRGLQKIDMKLCIDTCANITWLKPLVLSRDIKTLGYVYCCHYRDVMGKLEGLPVDLFRKYLTLEYDYKNKALQQVEEKNGHEDDPEEDEADSNGNGNGNGFSFLRK